MNTLEEAMQRILQLQDLLITEQKETLKLMAEIEVLKAHLVKEQDESFDRTASHMAGEYVSWTSCVACGQRVTGDSIHTCSPQLKQLTDEEIKDLAIETNVYLSYEIMNFARAILRKAQEK